MRDGLRMPKLSTVAIVSLSILLLEHCSSVTLARYTQQRVNAPNPAPTVAVLAAELLKLLMSVALELGHVGGLGSASSPPKLFKSVCGSMGDTLRVAVPAFLYTVQNNLIYIALANIEVVAFQVLYQSKLLLTALLSFAFLGSRFSLQQWASLVLLTAGVIAVEMSGAKTDAPQGARRHRLGVGAMASLVSALLSACAGVYFEAVVKKVGRGPSQPLVPHHCAAPCAALRTTARAAARAAPCYALHHALHHAGNLLLTYLLTTGRSRPAPPRSGCATCSSASSRCPSPPWASPTSGPRYRRDAARATPPCLATHYRATTLPQTLPRTLPCYCPLPCYDPFPCPWPCCCPLPCCAITSRRRAGHSRASMRTPTAWSCSTLRAVWWWPSSSSTATTYSRTSPRAAR